MNNSLRTLFFSLPFMYRMSKGREDDSFHDN